MLLVSDSLDHLDDVYRLSQQGPIDHLPPENECPLTSLLILAELGDQLLRPFALLRRWPEGGLDNRDLTGVNRLLPREAPTSS